MHNILSPPKKPVHKPCTFPIMGDTIHKIYGFHFSTSLYLNMGYFTMYHSPHSKYMIPNITEFGKFIYNWIMMGVFTSVDIFQDKLCELISDIEVFRTYINDILVIGKYFKSI